MDLIKSGFSYVWHNKLTIFAFIVTFFYFIWLWLLVGGVDDVLEQLKGLELNNKGDFLAGAFGPLMLFWLIVGYFQQQKELRQNTEALKKQAVELENAVKVERDALNSQVAPQFSITKVSDEYVGSDLILRIEMVNSGAPVDDVVMSALRHDLSTGITQKETHIPHNAKLKFIIKIGSEPEELQGDQRVLIMSNDLIGQTRFDSFTLKKHQGGYTARKDKHKTTVQLVNDLREIEEEL